MVDKSISVCFTIFLFVTCHFHKNLACSTVIFVSCLIGIMGSGTNPPPDKNVQCKHNADRCPLLTEMKNSLHITKCISETAPTSLRFFFDNF